MEERGGFLWMFGIRRCRGLMRIRSLGRIVYIVSFCFLCLICAWLGLMDDFWGIGNLPGIFEQWTHQIYHVLFLEQERKKARAVGGA